jgi:hypothetical protein
MAQTLQINQVGKREDLRDFISVADVRDRPLLAMSKKVEAPGNMRIDWQADKFDTADGDNAVADGVDVSSFDAKDKDRALISNYCQKFRKPWMVGDIAENISNIAGLSGGEAAGAVDKCLEEIGRDIETCIGSNNAAQLETGSTVPYKTRGLGRFLYSATRNGTSADTVLPIPAAYYTPAASTDTDTAATLTEAEFKDVLTSIFTQWGKQTTLDLVAGTALRNQITNYTQTVQSTNFYSSVRAFNQDLDGKKITSSITSYEGDYNTINLHTSLLLPSSSYGYVIPFDYMCLAWGRQPRIRQLEDQGGGPRGYVDAIIGLIVKNPTVFGCFEG